MKNPKTQNTKPSNKLTGIVIALGLVGGAAFSACHFDDGNETLEDPLQCETLFESLECGPGTVKLLHIGPGTAEYTNMDELGGEGNGNGMGGGVSINGSQVVTQVIESEGCFGACVIDNPCDNVVPSISNLFGDDDAGTGGSEPPPPPVAACVDSVSIMQGEDFVEQGCYFCPGPIPDEHFPAFLEACANYSCDDPPIPEPDDDGLDEDSGGMMDGGGETGADEDSGGLDEDSGGLDEDSGGPPPDVAPHDCTEWREMTRDVVEDKGIVYLPEYVAFHATQQDGLDMALCDDVGFAPTEEGIQITASSTRGILAKMGLEVGDTLVAFNGEPLDNLDNALAILVEAFYSGSVDSFNLGVQRRLRRFTVPVFVY